MAQIIIPTPLRKFTDNQGSVQTQGETVLGSIRSLTEKYPALQQHVLDEQGNIRNFVRIYVGDDDIKSLNNEQTEVQENSVISIIPAIAGGKS
uniref:MoaD/ThiS family protein n=1 Tax=Roseihalotalea indica TaxID=2867963 RepID=A0AA49JKF2_9BACT|nr:MoaD/ThiS family protein [Tunicatimonas sp. TK19036]